MTLDLFISEILFSLMGIISLFIAREFYISKDGRLRRLMIYYFISQFWVVAFSGTYFFLFESKGLEPIKYGIARILALSPITLTMVMLFVYLVRKNKNKVK